MPPVNACNLVLSTKDTIKLRKPAVEKMRRDRINNSIEQLKTLLHTELQAHQPNSKLEKADILETAVFYLKDNLHSAPVSVHAGSVGQGYSEGFSRCLEETLRFLSAHNQPSESKKLVSHFHRSQQTPGAESVLRNRPVVPSRNLSVPKSVTSAGARTVVWRPW
ncbi:hairy-related 2 [Osmerus eperlanus]|uniref:hairy-related 2 n=1 Tax=Osmerus eperlanus TaxID=29151 RepID=UPI002E1368C5